MGFSSSIVQEEESPAGGFRPESRDQCSVPDVDSLIPADESLVWQPFHGLRNQRVIHEPLPELAVPELVEGSKGRRRDVDWPLVDRETLAFRQAQ